MEIWSIRVAIARCPTLTGRANLSSVCGGTVAAICDSFRHSGSTVLWNQLVGPAIWWLRLHAARPFRKARRGSRLQLLASSCLACSVSDNRRDLSVFSQARSPNHWALKGSRLLLLVSPLVQCRDGTSEADELVGFRIAVARWCWCCLLELHKSYSAREPLFPEMTTAS